MSASFERNSSWIDPVAASVPAMAAGYAALKLAELTPLAAPAAMLVAATLVFLPAFAVMRAVPGARRRAPVAMFRPSALGEPDELLLDQPMAGRDDELLLDQPLFESRVAELAELVLDDPLGEITPDSRVVRLFARSQPASAADLHDRIERHLDRAGDRPPSDATDELTQALADLRRSLQRR